jgi:hypothetical protein
MRRLLETTEAVVSKTAHCGLVQDLFGTVKDALSGSNDKNPLRAFDRESVAQLLVTDRSV